MSTCERFDTEITPYVDGQLAVDARRALEAHLSTCAPCATQVAVELGARELVRRHAAALGATAPHSLRDRVAVPRPAAVVAFRPRRSVWRMVPLSAAAALLLAVLGVVGVGLVSPTGTLLAAQLSLDHMKCLLLDRTPGGSDPDTLAAHWQQQHGWGVEIPPTDDAVEFVGLRHCLFDGGSMAHLIYRHNGDDISLFVMPRVRQSERILAIMGHQAIVWHRDDRTYALVAQAGLPGADAVAMHLAERVR